MVVVVLVVVVVVVVVVVLAIVVVVLVVLVVLMVVVVVVVVVVVEAVVFVVVLVVVFVVVVVAAAVVVGGETHLHLHAHIVDDLHLGISERGHVYLVVERGAVLLIVQQTHGGLHATCDALAQSGDVLAIAFRTCSRRRVRLASAIHTYIHTIASYTYIVIE